MMMKSILPMISRDNIDSKQPVSDSMNAIMAVSMYAACSVTMVLTNKAISVSIDVEVRDRLPQLSVIAFQCLVAVILVHLAKIYKFVEYPDFDIEIAKKWMPLNVLFISMLTTGFLSLVYNNVPMVTVCKNLANLTTIFGEFYFFSESVSQLTLISALIMLSGAVMAGYNDLGFSYEGYFWMGANVLSTSGYVLFMRFASTNIKLPKFGMVFYNNLLSMVLLFPLIVLRGELAALMDPEIMTPYFIVANIAAGVLGFYLNFASLWTVSATSATTYAIVGSLNKIPITVLGFFLFDTQMTQEGILFIGMATLGGLLYGYSKLPGVTSPAACGSGGGPKAGGTGPGKSPSKEQLIGGGPKA